MVLTVSPFSTSTVWETSLTLTTRPATSGRPVGAGGAARDRLARTTGAGSRSAVGRRERRSGGWSLALWPGRRLTGGAAPDAAGSSVTGASTIGAGSELAAAGGSA